MPDLDALAERLNRIAVSLRYWNNRADAAAVTAAADALRAAREEIAQLHREQAEEDAGSTLALKAANEQRDAALRELAEARKELADHRCSLPSSISEALNSGDGTYRP